MPGYGPGVLDRTLAGGCQISPPPQKTFGIIKIHDFSYVFLENLSSDGTLMKNHGFSQIPTFFETTKLRNLTTSPKSSVHLESWPLPVLSSGRARQHHDVEPGAARGKQPARDRRTRLAHNLGGEFLWIFMFS